MMKHSRGRAKDPNSIRSLGKDAIQIDRPLKAKFKAQADDLNMTQVEYLAMLVDNAKPVQPTLVPGVRNEKDELKGAIMAITSMRPLTDNQLEAISQTWFGRVFTDEAIINTFKEVWQHIRARQTRSITPSEEPQKELKLE